MSNLAKAILILGAVVVGILLLRRGQAPRAAVSTKPVSAVEQSTMAELRRTRGDDVIGSLEKGCHKGNNDDCIAFVALTNQDANRRKLQAGSKEVRDMRVRVGKALRIACDRRHADSCHQLYLIAIAIDKNPREGDLWLKRACGYDAQFPECKR